MSPQAAIWGLCAMIMIASAIYMYVAGFKAFEVGMAGFVSLVCISFLIGSMYL